MLIEKRANILQFNEYGGNFDHFKFTAGVREALSLQLLGNIVENKKDLE